MSRYTHFKISGKPFVPRNDNQNKYIENIQTSFVTFGVGAAGTGKTFCAVAAALQMLQDKQAKKIIITRPAVEAGEKLGFLPGEVDNKIAPYLMPIFDSLDDLLGKPKRVGLMEKGVIEVCPLAYMRGRTLNDGIIILDEAQNTTEMQMKMFLTRIGKRSIAIVNGDISQNDLNRFQESGLPDAINKLDNIDGISITRFTSKDIVRHNVVQKIVDAYESEDKDDQAA